jgi:hypothetical protein
MTPLLMLYSKRKEDIEKSLEQIKSSEICMDYGNFASVRRRPMLTTVIYYLQYYAGYNDGVSLEELKAFLYCMLLAETNEYEKKVESIAWCPIEQTLKELGGRVRKTKGKFVVNKDKLITKNRDPPYWDILIPILPMAELICNDILNPSNKKIEELLSKPPSVLSNDPEMREYLSKMRHKIQLEKRRAWGD